METIGTVSKKFEIPAMTGGRSDEPFDLGDLSLAIVKHMAVGGVAPDFETKTLDGKPLKLSDFKGKHVLLDFWATWCGPCRGEMPKLKEVWAAYSKNPKFAMVSLSLDAKTAEPVKYIKDNGLDWTQGFLGEWSGTNIPAQYGVEGIPSTFLIDPDGRFAAFGMRGDGIMAAVKGALK